MATMSRRGLLKGLVAWSAGGFLFSASGCATPEQRIVVTAGAWPGYEPLFLARQLGWLDPQWVRLGEVPSNASSLHVLATGIADAAALTLDEVLLLRSQGVPLTVLLVFSVSDGADVLLARTGIRSLSELRGKRIALEQGTYAALLLDQALEAGGLTRTDVTQVYRPIGDHAQAWRNGEIDAAVSYSPYAASLEAAGAHLLFDSTRMPDTILDVLAVRSERLTSDREDALSHLIATHFRMLAYLANAPEDAVALIRARRHAPAMTVPAAYAGLILPDLAGNRRLLAGPSPVLLDKARMLAERMRQSSMLYGADDLGGLAQDRFLPVEDGEGAR